MPGGLYSCNPKLKQREHQNKLSTSKQNYLTVKEKTSIYQIGNEKGHKM